MCMSVLLAGMYEYHMCTWSPQRPEKDTRPGTGVTDGCAQLCGCWESNPDSLRTASVLNQWATSPSPNLRSFVKNNCHNCEPK